MVLPCAVLELPENLIVKNVHCVVPLSLCSRTLTRLCSVVKYLMKMGVFGGRTHNRRRNPEKCPCPQSITSKHNKTGKKRNLGTRANAGTLHRCVIWEFALARAPCLYGHLGIRGNAGTLPTGGRSLGRLPADSQDSPRVRSSGFSQPTPGKFPDFSQTSPSQVPAKCYQNVTTNFRQKLSNGPEIR